MKKSTLAMLCLLMILSAVFCLAGCKSREQRLSEESTYEDAHMKSMGKKVKKVSRSFFQRVHKRISKI